MYTTLTNALTQEQKNRYGTKSYNIKKLIVKLQRKDPMTIPGNLFVDEIGLCAITDL